MQKINQQYTCTLYYFVFYLWPNMFWLVQPTSGTDSVHHEDHNITKCNGLLIFMTFEWTETCQIVSQKWNNVGYTVGLHSYCMDIYIQICVKKVHN